MPEKTEKGISKFYTLKWGGGRISMGTELTPHIAEVLELKGKGDILITEVDKDKQEIRLKKI